MSSDTTEISPEAMFQAADLTLFDGTRELRLEVGRSLFGHMPFVRIESTDPYNPRRKPINLLRSSGLGADLMVGSETQTAADLLRLVAEMLDRAAGSFVGFPNQPKGSNE